MHAIDTLALPGSTSIALLLPEGLAYDDWAACGHLLGRVDRAIPWWVGDWLRYGEHRYGETYAQAASETGLAPQTLQNYQWVASRFAVSRRREDLSFGHHDAVAGLDDPKKQDRWLDRARKESLSVHALREALREERPAPITASTNGQDDRRQQSPAPTWKRTASARVFPLRVVGVDPGSHTGLVALDLSAAQIGDAVWLGHTVMNASAARLASYPERDANLHERLVEFFRDYRPGLVVFEEPFDAMIQWRGYRRQGRGTAFRLGVYYGLAVCAARVGAPDARLVSYPPTTHGKRHGWMRRRARNHVLKDLVGLARLLAAPADVFDVKADATDVGEGLIRDHVLMALGVVAYHLSQSVDPLAVAVGGNE